MDDGSSSGGSGDGGVPPFGAGMRREHFLFDADYVNLNHAPVPAARRQHAKRATGSFGTYPSAVRRQLREIQDAAEARPDHFLRYDSPPRLDIARGALAGLLRVPASEVVLVPNATTGVNTVLRNLRYAPGDAIVYFASIYGACEKTVEYLCETTPVSGFRVDVVYPAEDDVVVGLLRDAVRELKRKGARVRVAMFDTVVSIPGVRTPFELLVEMLREEDPGILTLIDGAHGVGHIPLDLRKLDADFFVSNCHK
ncbi:MAG: hypothetical protein M1839_009017 [Geoglossum umbratile]|nr:MAG: hypothetical protein M1839_009017 [Geoglossum umbratile]